MIKNCKYCQKEFKAYGERAQYCSRSCSSKATTTIHKWVIENGSPLSGTKRSEDARLKTSQSLKQRYKDNPMPCGKLHPASKPKAKCIDCGKELLRRRNKRCRPCLEAKWRDGTRVSKGGAQPRGGTINFKCEQCGADSSTFRNLYEKYAHHFCNKKCRDEWRAIFMRGENHPLYNGRAELYERLKSKRFYLKWRKEVLEKDGNKCTSCGEHNKNLEAHHIISLAEIFDKYNLKTTKEIYACELLKDVTNGTTLCKPCHIALHKTIGYPRRKNKVKNNEKNYNLDTTNSFINRISTTSNFQNC